MVMFTVWKWKDLDEDDMMQAMGATAVLDYPEGYQNFVFLDGSGGFSIGPEDEDPEQQAIRGHVVSKFCTMETHHAMPQEDALAIGGKVVEILRNLAED